jgi:catechol 2,3-dioxygenase-like lactoylglutathione lyase family enzyme
MITAAHLTVFAEDAEAARAFFRDVLEFPCADSGEGWLTFALPPTELAVHPGSGWGHAHGRHMLFLICDDIDGTVEHLSGKGVEFVSPVADEGFGRLTRLRVPGAGEIGLFEPNYPSPIDHSGPG